MSSALFPSPVQNLAVALNTKYRHGMLGEENQLLHVTAKSHISPTRLSRRRVGASALATHLLTHRQTMIITAQNRRWIVIAILASIFAAFLAFPLLFFFIVLLLFFKRLFLVMETSLVNLKTESAFPFGVKSKQITTSRKTRLMCYPKIYFPI